VLLTFGLCCGAASLIQVYPSVFPRAGSFEARKVRKRRDSPLIYIQAQKKVCCLSGKYALHLAFASNHFLLQMKVDFIFTASIDLVEAGVGFEVGERERE
jgi:hypothetical protein